MNFLFNTKTNKSIEIDKSNKCLLTLSTCFYILKSKFNINTYLIWIKNFLSIVSNFNLVIYTDAESYKLLLNLIDINNKRIIIIIKPLELFYTFKYKNNWIKNHNLSNLNLHNHIDWKLNMLWNEKVFFVNQTIKNKYFDSLYYGWCDIGYFRNRVNDLNTRYLSNWPNNNKLLSSPFNENYIHYACVQNDVLIYEKLSNDINNHYKDKLIEQPSYQIEEICFAGGFFILKSNLLDSYIKLYDEKLEYYFKNNFIIKDDQTIIMDIILTNQKMFYIHKEENERFDNWFMFQRLLL